MEINCILKINFEPRLFGFAQFQYLQELLTQLKKY